MLEAKEQIKLQKVYLKRPSVGSYCEVEPPIHEELAQSSFAYGASANSFIVARCLLITKPFRR